jgi:uncharacterized Fe-S cluster-containing radical SAM superfamily protein
METQKKNTPRFRPNSGLKRIDQAREAPRYYSNACTEETRHKGTARSIYRSRWNENIPGAPTTDLAVCLPVRAAIWEPTDWSRASSSCQQEQFTKSGEPAARLAEIDKRVSCRTFRHKFPTRLLQQGYDTSAVQELVGHKGAQTTMIYARVLDRGERVVRSPLDSKQAG